VRRVGAIAVAFMLGGLAGALTASGGHPLAQATSSPIASGSAVVSLVAQTPSPTSSNPPAVRSTSVTTMSVMEGDMYLRPTSSTTLPTGIITFRVTNQGAIHHEFVIVSGDPTGTVGDEPSTVSEADHIGGPNGPELGDVHPGQTRTMTANFAPGTYTAMCNYPGHFAAGMHFQFTVSAPIAVLNVMEGDMYLRPTGSTTLPTGVLAFRVTNQGAIHHEFVIVSGDPTGTVGDEPSTVSEADHIGGPNGPELGDVHPGQTTTMTAIFAPGTYTAMCNYPGHFAAGMHFQFTVQ
jgi:uncharacterized cupredoxin-like copper-binding protein